MSKKVFVLGAGFNQFLKKIFDNNSLKTVENLGFDYGDMPPNCLAPPMSKNFFRYSLIRQFYSGKSFYGVNDKVLDYIEKIFNRPRTTLLSSDFDLELLFSFLEAQINDAKTKNADTQLNYLEEIRLNLIILIGDTFFDLGWRLPTEGRDLLRKFGQLIYQTKSNVITFNYDCLPEWAIEQASGKRTFEEWQEGNTIFNWDKYSAYGIKFTKIRDGGDGYYDAERGRNIAKKFYEKYHKNSPEFRFIKLHGSHNWYKYSNFKRNLSLEFSNFNELATSGKLYTKSKKIPKSLENEIICFNGDWQFGLIPTWSHSKLHYLHVLEPIIIPPILFKEHELKKDIFQQLWDSAKEILLKCEEIIFIGYSFPDTDFYSKKLFIEVFSENKNIAVTMVNPDRAAEDKFRELVNFRGLIKRYVDSGEFIRSIKLG